MVGKERNRFLNAFGTLCITFDKEPSEILVGVYFKALSSFSIEQVERTISEAIATLKFFPKPVELIEIATGGGGRLEDVAEVEAGLVMEAIRRVGHYASVKFADPVTSAVILKSFGGWHRICQNLKSGQEKWFMKDFVKAYQAYARLGIKHEGHLPGQCEIDNVSMGYDRSITPPALIGDHEKQLTKGGDYGRINGSKKTSQQIS